VAELRTPLTIPEVLALLVTSLVGRLPTAMAIPSSLLMRGQGGDYALVGVAWLGPRGGLFGCAGFSLAGTLGFALTRTSRIRSGAWA
jgi:hypothetical protein